MTTAINPQVEQGFRHAIETVLTAPGATDDKLFNDWMCYIASECDDAPVEPVVMRLGGMAVTTHVGHRTQGTPGACVTKIRQGEAFRCFCGRVIWDDR